MAICAGHTASQQFSRRSVIAYRITGLDATAFRHLYGLSEEALQVHGVTRHVADRTPGFPDRIELRDADPGETLLLLNYTHQPAPTAYRASHAIFIREGALHTYDVIDTIPAALHARMISLRAFNSAGEMLDADLVDGRELSTLIVRLFANAQASYLHAHYARRGCYAARIERA